MTVTQDITCLDHLCSPASRQATGTNLSQNASVQWLLSLLAWQLANRVIINAAYLPVCRTLV